MQHTKGSILELHDISKSYPGVQALDKVSLRVKPGSVHALLGENGAGKSTLIKVISGAIYPDMGTIMYDGQAYSRMEPDLAIELGIRVIYQEFNLVPYLTVANNIFLGHEIIQYGRIDERACERKTRELLANMGLDINPATQVRELSVGFRQMVEIAKAVSGNVKVLIMDEPTAALSEKEVKKLFELIRKLKNKGVAIIYISHRLEELFEVADEVTVMRDGQYINTLQTSACNRQALIEMMVGREMAENYPKGCFASDDIVLELNKVTNQKVKDISFKLHKGEVLGFAGLVGSGRTEVARAIFGADPIESGEVLIDGRKASISTPEDAVQKGIALLTEDRKQQGLLLKLSVRENISISYLNNLLKKRIRCIDVKRERECVQQYVGRLDIRTPSIEQLTRNLSGGNQQKVVLAKWLLTNSRILIFDEPTRGIDVGVKFEIYQIIKDLAKQGMSVIMISSEMPELIGVSDRILVMREGQIQGELSKEEASQQAIMSLAM